MRKLTILLCLIINLSGCQVYHATSPVTLPTSPITVAAPIEIETPTAITRNENTPSTTSASSLFAYAWNDPTPYRAGLSAFGQEGLDKLPQSNVYHMVFSVSDDLSTANGQMEVRYINQETLPLNEIWFHLFPNILGGKMEITAASVNGIDISPRYGKNNSTLSIQLNAPLMPGEEVIISLAFITAVPNEVELSYGVLSNVNGVLSYAHGYPMAAVYNKEGWNTETPAPYGDVTFSDASFYIVQIASPTSLTIAATGNEITRNQSGENQQITFAHGPARDFTFMASSNFSPVSRMAGGITITAYAPEDYKTASLLAMETAFRALESFSERYAPYPYTELDIVTTPNLALGIEYPGLIVMTDRIMRPDPQVGIEQAKIYIESVMAHEVGHQWFYNLVGSDQLDEPWLDESLCQFVTMQYYEDTYGQPGAQRFKQSLQDRWWAVKNQKIPIGLPVEEYSEKEYSAIVYGRGGLFFLALRDQMGQSAFDAFMKDYTTSYSWEIADTESLKTIAEKHCQCDLTTLFRAWIYKY